MFCLPNCMYLRCTCVRLQTFCSRSVILFSLQFEYSPDIAKDPKLTGMYVCTSCNISNLVTIHHIMFQIFFLHVSPFTSKSPFYLPLHFLLPSIPPPSSPPSLPPSLPLCRTLWASTNNTVGFNHMIASAPDAEAYHQGTSSGPVAYALETMYQYTAYFPDNDPREVSKN